jgi:hypothetical protein
MTNEDHAPRLSAGEAESDVLDRKLIALRRNRFSAASTARRAVRDCRKRIQSAQLLIRIGRMVARNWRKSAI